MHWHLLSQTVPTWWGKYVQTSTACLRGFKFGYVKPIAETVYNQQTPFKPNTALSKPSFSACQPDVQTNAPKC
jgi:hypothetical protein